MSEDDDWDSENFLADAQPIPGPISLIVNQWEGEDEEEVKDSWDDPEEEEQVDKGKEIEQPDVKGLPVKKTKKLLSKIEEREKKIQEALEKKLQLDTESMTPEEIQEQKLRQLKLQEEADLEVAKHLLGDDITSSIINDNTSGSVVVRDSIPVLNISENKGDSLFKLDTKEDFEKYKDMIVKQLNNATKNQNFPGFVEQLVQALCVHLSAAELKKLNTWVGNLHIDKLKIEQGSKSKKKSGKGKAKLKVDNDADIYNTFNEDLYDDFM